MKVKLNKGICPSSSLFGDRTEVKLKLNTMDAWECPKCRITFNQIGQNEVGLNDSLGKGSFKAHQLDPAKYLNGMTIYRKPKNVDEPLEDCKIDEINELYTHLVRLNFT